MPRNIEIKAIILDFEEVERRVASFATDGPFYIYQDDTFFNCKDGRLKLREFSKDKGELIFYNRADQDGPKQSFYSISNTTEPSALRKTLLLAYGESGRVIKKRILYRYGRTRIHLDKVESLGEFLELEVALNNDEELNKGIIESEHIMERLYIKPHHLIKNAYVDLINEKRS